MSYGMTTLQPLDVILVPFKFFLKTPITHNSPLIWSWENTFSAILSLQVRIILICSRLYTFILLNSSAFRSYRLFLFEVWKGQQKTVLSISENYHFKCSHRYYCDSDGYQMNEALFVMCTGPLQLNQNQHVLNEFDKTDAM